MKEEILEELNIKEDHERECKLATGGLPESIWETYSSFANTNGGTILLGIREHRDSFTVEGLTDKQIVKYQKDFWSTLNDRNKVSKKWYTNENIDQMLMERHLNKKARRSSHKNHMKGCTMSGGHRFCTDRSGNGDQGKRTEEDDVRFAQSFEKIILMAKSKEGAQSGTI